MYISIYNRAKREKFEQIRVKNNQNSLKFARSAKKLTFFCYFKAKNLPFLGFRGGGAFALNALWVNTALVLIVTLMMPS